VQSHNYQYCEIHANVRVLNEVKHGRKVWSAWKRFNRWVGVPFADVVELLIVVAGAREELSQKIAVVLRVSYKMGGCPASSLKGNVSNAERVVGNMLANQNAADFTTSSSQLTPETFDYREGQQQFHLSELQLVQQSLQFRQRPRLAKAVSWTPPAEVGQHQSGTSQMAV
jgi:hypothetical protein